MAPTKGKGQKKPKRVVSYTAEKLQRCLQAIENKELTSFAASKLYNIPRSTISSKLHGQRPKGIGKSGPKAYLGDIVEDKIEQWVLDCASRGFPIVKNSLLFTAQSFIKSLSPNVRKTLPFKDKPGSSWWRNFLIRHPVVNEKKTEYIRSLRIKPTEERIRQWFNKTQIMMDADAVLNVLNNPSRLFCVDETMLWLNPNKVEILEENEELIKNPDEKDYVTVCLTICADGSYAPPTFIFKNQRLPAVYNLSCPEEWNVDCTMNGTSTCESFFTYISEIFLPYLIKKEIERPIILYMNGNASYHSLPLTNYCRENGINLVSFPPWATQILQPLHGYYTKSLKLRWREMLKKYTAQYNREVKKYEVPSMFKNLLNNYNTQSTTIQNRFQKCGLYPFDPESVDYERCRPYNGDDSLTDELCQEEFPILSRRTFMDVFEGAMQPELLAKFRNHYHANGTWTGDVRQAGFFDFWVKMHKEEAAFYQEDANGTFSAGTNKSYIHTIENIDLMTEGVEIIVHDTKIEELQENDITLDSANVTFCEFSTIDNDESASNNSSICRNNCNTLNHLVQEVTNGLDSIENTEKSDESLPKIQPVSETLDKDSDVSPALLGAMKELYKKLDCVLFNNTPQTSKRKRIGKT